MSSAFISIQGNIGSGKSTILKIIKQSFPQLTILDQPLASWENVGQNNNVNLLKLYYEKPERWGFTFQMFAFMTRLKKWTEFSKLDSKEIKVSQRSLLSDRYIFASIMRDIDILSEAQHEIYLNCYENLIKMQKIAKVQGVLYIQCDPQTCSERIKKRARQGEGEIPLDYLQKLHQKHEKWLNPSINQLQTQEYGINENVEQMTIGNSEQRQAKSSSMSITDQKVLIIDNRVPIDKNRLISQVRAWITNFNISI